MAIEHLSPSSVQTYRKCGRITLYQKVMGMPNTTVYASTQYGSAMHDAAEMWFTAKMNGLQPHKDFFVNLFTDNMNKYAKNITVWGEDTLEHLLQQGIEASKDFIKIIEKITPIAVEKEFIIQRSGDWFIKSKCDLIDSNNTIYDYKFGRGLWGKAQSSEYMLNMSTYALGYFNEYGCFPEVKMIKQTWRGELNKATRKKKWFHKGFEVDTLKVNEKWIEYYLEIYDAAEKGIKAGIFLPVEDGNTGLCKNCCYRNNPCSVIINNWSDE